MSFNVKNNLFNNIEAIKIAIRKEQSKEELSEEDKEKLGLYSGWGGIKSILFSPYNDEEWTNASAIDKTCRYLVKELHEYLKTVLATEKYNEVISSIKNSILSQFFTPNWIPDTFYKVLSQFVKIDKIIDPSAGHGVFLQDIKTYFPESTTIAIEKDLVTCGVLKARFSSPTVDRKSTRLNSSH